MVMATWVSEIVPTCDTEEQGAAVYDAIVRTLAVSDVATVSFVGIDTTTSSFVNAAFVPLLEILAFEEIKRRVRVVDSTRQIRDMVKSRLISEASRVLRESREDYNPGAQAI